MDEVLIVNLVRVFNTRIAPIQNCLNLWNMYLPFSIKKPKFVSIKIIKWGTRNKWMHNSCTTKFQLQAVSFFLIEKVTLNLDLFLTMEFLKGVQLFVNQVKNESSNVRFVTSCCYRRTAETSAKSLDIQRCSHKLYISINP